MKHRDPIRAGLLVPAGNMALEYELPRWLPESIALNVARVWRPGGTTLSASALAAMQQNIAPALDQLDRLPLRVALFGCTSGSFVGQPDAPEAIERQITAARRSRRNDRPRGYQGIAGAGGEANLYDHPIPGRN